MGLRHFTHRLGLKVQKRISRDSVVKRILEINYHGERVKIMRDGYFIKELNMLLPRRSFDFVFSADIFDIFLRLPRLLHGNYCLESGSLMLEFDALKIIITSKSELYIINEVFNEKCYNFLMPSDCAPVHVVDIGMNVGLASLFFAGLPYVEKVHAFEPFLPTFAQAQNNFILNTERAAKITAYNFGLGMEECEITATYDPSNSGINTSRVTHDTMGTSVPIRIKPAFETIASIIDSFPTDQFVLKIDTEGAEYQIVDSISKRPLSKQIKGVMLEWHFYGPKPLEDYFVRNGFMVTSFVLSRNSGLIYAFR